MINPTSGWLLKHGFCLWGTHQDREYYYHTVHGKSGLYTVKITKVANRQAPDDRAKRKLIYDAIEEAMSEVS